MSCPNVVIGHPRWFIAVDSRLKLAGMTPQKVCSDSVFSIGLEKYVGGNIKIIVTIQQVLTLSAILMGSAT